MSDESTRFGAELRRSFDADTVARAVRQPALADLRGRVGGRRRKRRTGVALVLVPLLGLAALVPSMAGGPSPAPAPSPTAGPDDSIGLYETVGTEHLAFFSPTEAVTAREVGCMLQFGTTTDGGRTWDHHRQQPSRPTAVCETGHLPWDAPVQVQFLDMRTYQYTLDGVWQLTRDAGETTQPTAEAVTMVDAFPAGARVVDCGTRCKGTARTPFAIDPASGTVFQLKLATLAGWEVTAYAMGGDRLWALLAPEAQPGQGRVAWSTDRGATWKYRQVDAGAMPHSIAAGAGGRAYFPFLHSEDAVTSDRVLATTDGGATWSTTTTDLPGSRTRPPFTVGAGGALMALQDSGSALVSRDATRFTPGVNAGAAGTFGADGGNGLLWLWEPGRPATAYVTGDGATWTPVPLPTE